MVVSVDTLMIFTRIFAKLGAFMDLVEKIRDNFNKGYNRKAMVIDGLGDDFPAWTIKYDDYIGVLVPYLKDDDFSESFASATIRTIKGIIIDESTEINALLLSCENVSLRDEFSVICAQFVDPGLSGVERKSLIDNPGSWWERWKVLLGNAESNSETYSLLGEICLVEYLLKQKKNVHWSGVYQGTHDIETPEDSYEVKSTTLRYSYEVTISSIYQMEKAGKHLYLVFCRFERSNHGRCLDELIKSIVSLGLPQDEIEMHMRKKGFEKGRTARSVKYKLLEMKIYEVDNSFPKITEHSFKNDQMPPNITKFKYTIDLSGVACKNLL